MEEIVPKQPWGFREAIHSIDFWIKLWGVGLVLAGLSLFLIKTPWSSLLLTAGCGLALIFGKRTYAIRIIGLFFSAFLAFGGFVFTYYHSVIEPDTFRWYYFFLFFVFFTALFTFLLMPDVKQAFGPSPIPKKPLPVLTSQEEKRIKFWVRGVALGMGLEGLLSSTFSDWFRSHGLPPEGPLGTALGVVAGLGLLVFRQNIGRRFGLFVCLATFGGLMLSNFGKTVFGLWGYLYTIAMIVIFLAAFLFLLHPKTKAVFK